MIAAFIMNSLVLHINTQCVMTEVTEANGMSVVSLPDLKEVIKSLE